MWEATRAANPQGVFTEKAHFSEQRALVWQKRLNPVPHSTGLRNTLFLFIIKSSWHNSENAAHWNLTLCVYYATLNAYFRNCSIKNIEKLIREKCTHISKDMYFLPITKCTHDYNITVKMQEHE